MAGGFLIAVWVSGTGKELDTSNFPGIDLQSSLLKWRPVAQILPRLDLQLQSWLLDPGSLTWRLKDMAGSKFRVEVLEERWELGLSPALLQCFPSHVAGQRMWSRKVLLKNGHTPWVYAHSLIPVSSLMGPLKQLRKLSNRPLGEFLFRDYRLQRQQLEVAHLDDVTGRRSLFYLHGKPLLVAEFYLPALLDADAKCLVSSKSR